MENEAIIKSLGEKVERIISDNKALRVQLQTLSREREKLAGQKREAEQRILELEKRIKVLETTGSFIGNRADNRAARLRVNKLLREIDNCIALLNR